MRKKIHSQDLKELVLLQCLYYEINPQIQCKIPMAYVTELEHIILKFVWNQKDTNYQSNL